jgi:hypothetical protein
MPWPFGNPQTVAVNAKTQAEFGVRLIVSIAATSVTPLDKWPSVMLHVQDATRMLRNAAR